jgi:hypothetical protein
MATEQMIEDLAWRFISAFAAADPDLAESVIDDVHLEVSDFGEEAHVESYDVEKFRELVAGHAGDPLERRRGPCTVEFLGPNVALCNQTLQAVAPSGRSFDWRVLLVFAQHGDRWRASASVWGPIPTWAVEEIEAAMTRE